MKVLTKEIAAKTPKLHETDGQGDSAIATAHYFFASWDWYMVELDESSMTAFGLVVGFEIGLGYFNLREFEEINEKYGFDAVERDLYWKPKSIGEIKETECNGLYSIDPAQESCA